MHWFCTHHTSTQNTWQQTKYFNVDFDSNGLFLFLYFKELPSIQKKLKYLFGKIFGSLDTSNWIYLLRNYISNYVYLKDMYIALKGIRKILFASGLRILLVCKFVNFTTVFTKKLKNIKLSKVCMQISVQYSFKLLDFASYQ